MDKTKYISRVSGHALVFGGSGGIGREIVRALVASGATAISFTYGRNKRAAEELAEELRAEGVHTHYASIDIPTTDTDVAAIERFLDNAVLAVGEEISVAVNTIGISPNIPLHEQTIDHPEHGWKQVFAVNAIGNFFLARTVAERMKAKKIMGAIVFLSSDNATVSWSPISAHYDASKAAVEQSVLNLAMHYRPIRVLAVAPGWTNTPMNDTLPEDERKNTLSRIWLGRYAEPSEIARVVAFVAGSGGSFINGTTVVVNGGYH
jgi:3-oxoacyl-[acyl-carrier protein] reductase